MVTEVIGERAAVFNYGFLSTKTSKLLSDIEKRRARPSQEEDLRTLEKAEQFLAKIINGQRLIAGERGEGFKPSLEGVEAVSYALNILSILQSESLIDRITQSSDIQQIFQNIYEVLKKINSDQLDQIDKKNMDLAKNFFLRVSRKLVSDAQDISQLRSPTTL